MNILDLQALEAERDLLAERIRLGQDRLEAWYAERGRPLTDVVGTDHWRRWRGLLAEYEALTRRILGLKATEAEAGLRCALCWIWLDEQSGRVPRHGWAYCGDCDLEGEILSRA